MTKALLVLGGSSNIGTSFLASNHAHFDHLIVQYRTWNEQLSKIEETCGDKTHFYQADFEELHEVESMIKKIQADEPSPTHILHLPSLPFKLRKFAKIPLTDFSAEWVVSVRSIVQILQAFLPCMKKQHFGRIVFMLSIVTEGQPPKYEADYVTTKYALLGLMKALAVEYAGTGITINAISPDMMETQFLDSIPSLMVEEYKQQRPNNALLESASALTAISFLLEDAAHSINGVNLPIA